MEKAPQRHGGGVDSAWLRSTPALRMDWEIRSTPVLPESRTVDRRPYEEAVGHAHD
ncbi:MULTISPECIES: hypothetical protein [Streptomyces]|uniref:Uncharacterized protein n=1 Tax=Streptomyces sp. 900129855 TaxID=3155129 RepID=A0ABV2ZDE1_9ACTN